MSTERSSLKRARVWIAAALVSIACSTAAEAQYALTGNARYQAGFGLPVPIGTTPAPDGRVLAVPGATAMQTPGADPKQMTLLPGQLTAPGAPVDVGIFLGGGSQFQVHSAVGVQWPGATATFRAGGRTGPPVVSFCAGDVVTPAYNPLCANAGAGNPLNGRMRYTKTVNQFGGAARAAVGGAASVALRVGASAPCDFQTTPACQAIFVPATPLLAAGGAFASSDTDARTALSPGRFHVRVTAGGAVTYVAPTGLGPGLANPATSFAGPWTTGRITISTTNTLGVTPQIFVLTGSDARVSGVGSISLVSGSIGYSTLSGPTVQRGWLNLFVAAVPAVPALGPRSVGVLVALLVGAAWVARRRIRFAGAAGLKSSFR